MSSTNNSPTDVTLEKSSSGSWEPPKPRRYRFSAWQRLWLVTGITYLLIISGSYYLLMPNEESIERQMVFSVTEEVKRFSGLAFAGESPRKTFETARSQGVGSWISSTRAKYYIGHEGDPGFAKIENTYRTAIIDLPTKQTVGILICALIWLVPMALFYAVGFVVDWIKRGVRGS